MNLGSMFFFTFCVCYMIKRKVSEVLLLYYIAFTFSVGRKKLNSYIKYEANNIFFQSERKLWVKESVCYISCALNENASFVLGFFFRFFFFRRQLLCQLLWPIYFCITQKKLGFLRFMVIVNMEIWKKIFYYISGFRRCCCVRIYIGDT